MNNVLIYAISFVVKMFIRNGNKMLICCIIHIKQFYKHSYCYVMSIWFWRIQMVTIKTNTKSVANIEISWTILTPLLVPCGTILISIFMIHAFYFYSLQLKQCIQTPSDKSWPSTILTVFGFTYSLPKTLIPATCQRFFKNTSGDNYNHYHMCILLIMDKRTK